MIAAGDAANISRLIKQLSRDSSTENTIAFFADTEGMLQSCKKVLAFYQEGNNEVSEWLHNECGKQAVPYLYFVQEAGQILELFGSNDEKQDHYVTLGLSSAASPEEVKRAYRKLSAKYHPDTAGKGDGEATERFIQISRAYHAISNIKQESTSKMEGRATPSWHYGNPKKASGRVFKKAMFGIFALVLLIVGASVLVSQIYSRKVMLSTLKLSGGAFVPPVKKVQAEESEVALTFAEKMQLAEKNEKKRQEASRKESVRPIEISQDRAEPPEQKVVTVDMPGELEPKVTPLPREPAPALPEPAEIKPQTVSHVAAVEKTKTAQDVRIKEEKIIIVPAPEGGVVEKHKPVQPLQQVSAPERKKEEIVQRHEPEPQLKPEPVPVAYKHDDAVKKEVAPPAVVETQQKELPLEPAPELTAQQRIDTFLAEYCRAYGDKNLMAFIRFFELGATENGKPITELVGTYTDLFDSTQTIGLQILTLKWDESSQGRINLNGRFKIDLVYQNAEAVHGQGKIDFLLVEEQGRLLVKKMDYSFDQ